MKVLVIIDMQNDFITGSLGTKEAQAIVPKVCEKIEKWDGKVLFTQDTHYENYLETQEGNKLPIKHCIKDTEGWEICDVVLGSLSLNELIHSESFFKVTFGSESLVTYFKALNQTRLISEIQLIGVCTDICVISNALLLKAFLPEVPIIVDASCCAGVTPESHKNALEAMKMCQVEIINE